MKKILASFLIVITLISNLSLNVHASSIGGGGYAHKWVGWTDEEKKAFCRDKLTGAILQRVGVLIQPDKWTSEEWTNAWNKHLGEIEIASSMTYDEYIMSLVSVNEENEEFIIPDSLVDSFYNVANIYIEDYTGWYSFNTFKFENIDAGLFNTYSDYTSLQTFFNSQESDDIIAIYNANYKYNNVDNGSDGSGNGIVLYVFDADTSFVKSYESVETLRVKAYKEWELLSDFWHVYNYSSKNLGSQTYNGISNTNSPISVYKTNNYGSCGLFTRDGRSIRIYKTVEDMKQYSVGQRPYYVTEKFVNYDSTVDNSTTITQTEIDNSITYGDVITYITNNYENPDGLTEEELRAILEEYLSQIGGGSGGGSGGSDDDDDGGGGLGGFLDGLGSFGNAILAILGKLMEILGSALELITGSITDLITIIPNSVGDLLGALFPVFPEEWIKAITLSLVLGVIVGIVRIFK